MDAKRYNKNKPQLSYLFDAPDAIIGFCQVMTAGTLKYGRDNWKKGQPTNQMLDSLLRHILALKKGNLVDDESGLLHVDHIVANAMMLSQYEHNKGEKK